MRHDTIHPAGHGHACAGGGAPAQTSQACTTTQAVAASSARREAAAAAPPHQAAGHRSQIWPKGTGPMRPASQTPGSSRSWRGKGCRCGRETRGREEGRQGCMRVAIVWALRGPPPPRARGPRRWPEGLGRRATGAGRAVSRRCWTSSLRELNSAEFAFCFKYSGKYSVCSPILVLDGAEGILFA